MDGGALLLRLLVGYGNQIGMVKNKIKNKSYPLNRYCNSGNQHLNSGEVSSRLHVEEKIM